MPPRRSANSAPPANIAPVVVAVGFVGMFAGFYFGFPGFAILLLALVFAGFSAVPPVFNGKKDAQGRPTPADEGEKRAMNVYRLWGDLKWRLLLPNTDWLPGMQASRPRKSVEYVHPLNYVWVIALALGALAFAIPTPGPVELLKGSETSELLFRALNSFAVFSMIVCVNTARRRNETPDDPCPGVTLGDSLKYLGTPKAIPLFFASGVASGVAAMALLVFGGQNGLERYISPIPLPAAAAIVFVLIYATALYLGTRTDALEHWRLVASKRPEWESRWAPVLKSTDTAPRLVDYEEVGFFEVSTFEASPSMGYLGVLAMEAKIAPALGQGRQATILSCPDVDSMGQPMPGTINSVRFRVVTYPSDELVDFSNPETDPKLIELGADVAMMRVIAANGLGRPVFMETSPAFTIPDPEEEPDTEPEPEDDSDSPETPKRKWWQRRPRVEETEETETYTASWLAHWAVPNGPPFEYLADYAEDIGAEAGCEVVIDKRTGDIFFGSLSDPTTPWTNPKDAERVKNIRLDNVWARRWKNIFQGKSEFVPRREAHLYSELKVGDIPIYRQPFSMGQGVELKQYDKLEDKLAVALDSAPMVAITGFKAQGDREGARHPQGMCVVWSPSAQMPSSPERLKPGSRAMANEWVLTWMLNRAFDHTKRLARPEIISAKCLTSPDSSGHIWEMKLRLYGGVTLEEVRSASEKIRQSMACQWIRIIEDTYGCTIAAGVKPNAPGVKLANPRTADRIAELNWEQAFAISGVSGHGGVLPKMVNRSTMEKNKKVAVLDFALPAGCEVEDVKKVVGKLSPATDNAFIQVSETEDPKIIRILASERNPLEKYYETDWEAIESSPGIPFSTGVDGSDVVFDPKDTAHLMLLGLSGSGKSATVQCFLYGALRRNWHVFVINPVKGAGDYMFAERFMDGSCLELDDFFAPAAAMKALYEEVSRRMRLIGQYGVTKVGDLPEEVRPRHYLVILDEFTSLIELDAVPARSDDAELEAERDLVVARNTAKRYIAQYAGKILREARAAGFSLLLATQKLTAKSLDPVPGGADMKSQLSRLLLGNANYGDKMSALRQPDKAPDLGNVVPAGRGIYEPSTGVGQIIQSWYANVREYEKRLDADMTPVAEEERLQYQKFVQRPEDSKDDEIELPDAFAVFDDFDSGFTSFGDDPSDSDGETPIVIGEEVSFSLDDIISADEEDSTEKDPFEDAVEFTLEAEAESPPEEEHFSFDGVEIGDPDTDTTEDDPFASFDFEPDENPADADESADSDEDLPVVVEERGKPATSPTGEAETPLAGRGSVLFLDIDGVIAPMAPTPATVSREVPGMGMVEIDVDSIERFAGLDTDIVWLTDWDRDLANKTFAPMLHRGAIPAAPSAPGDEYWWKVESILRWLDDHPETESVIWVDDRIDHHHGESTHREQITDLMDMLGVRFLGVCPANSVGMTPKEWSQINVFLGEEEAIETFEEDADFDFEDVATPAPKRAEPKKTRAADDDDDPFGDVAPSRVVTGRVGNTGRVEGDDRP